MKKLQPETIMFIRRSLREGVPLSRLAAMFKVSRGAIVRHIIEHPARHIALGEQSAG